MILSDRDFKKALETKKIIINPEADLETQLSSCSLDLKLGNTFRIFRRLFNPGEQAEDEFVDVLWFTRFSHGTPEGTHVKSIHKITLRMELV